MQFEHMHDHTAHRQRRLQVETGSVSADSIPVEFVRPTPLPPHQFVQVYHTPDKFPPPAVGAPDGFGGFVSERRADAPAVIGDPSHQPAPESAPVASPASPHPILAGEPVTMQPVPATDPLTGLPRG